MHLEMATAGAKYIATRLSKLLTEQHAGQIQTARHGRGEQSCYCAHWFDCRLLEDMGTNLFLTYEAEISAREFSSIIGDKLDRGHHYCTFTFSDRSSINMTGKERRQYGQAIVRDVVVGFVYITRVGDPNIQINYFVEYDVQ